MPLSRRIFLRNSALAMVGVGSAPLWLQRAALAESAAGSRKKVLVAIFQRGAADGLNIVVPHGEQRYYDLRPAIAIPRPSTTTTRDRAIDLDGFFGLHPSLAALKPIWDRQQLAIVHAVGSPDPTRSHFDAQDYMESGTPGLKATGDGWLNRALAPATVKPSPLRAISLGPTLPALCADPTVWSPSTLSATSRCATRRPRRPCSPFTPALTINFWAIPVAKRSKPLTVAGNSEDSVSAGPRRSLPERPLRREPAANCPTHQI